jgi:hypothetical protein
MLKSFSFSHNGRDFEVRAATMDNEIKVCLFEKNRLASPVSYNVTVETAFDAKTRGFPLDLVDELMALMEQDTISGRLRPLPNSN